MSATPEKQPTCVENENGKSEGQQYEQDIPAIYNSWTVEYREATEARLLRKIDMRIMPCLILIYIMNYLDRTSVTQARLYGMQEDLGITGAVWQLGISILSVPYILSQIPATLLIARMRPSILLPTTMILWAIVSACTGATHNVASFLAVRVLLGATEGPFFPAAIFFLTCWYRKRELGVRIAMLMSGLVTSQAFAGLISAGILKGMEGVTSLASWRWLFIIEGLLTVVIGIAALFILPDFPHTTRWLTPEEKVCAIQRLAEDVGKDELVENERVSIKRGFLEAVKDYHVWLYACMQMANTACISFSYFFPTLIRELGFKDNTAVLLMSAPPYALGFISIISLSYYTDRAQVRSSVGIGSMCVAIAGIIVTLALRGSAKWVSYVMLFPIVCGIYTTYCITYTWLSSTILRPQEKRAAAIGISNTCANSAVLFGSFMWLDRYAPTYAVSWSCVLAFGLLSITCSATLRFCLTRENKRLDKIVAEVDATNEAQVAALDDIQRAAVLSGFRYVV